MQEEKILGEYGGVVYDFSQFIVGAFGTREAFTETLADPAKGQAVYELFMGILGNSIDAAELENSIKELMGDDDGDSKSQEKGEEENQ